MALGRKRKLTSSLSWFFRPSADYLPRRLYHYTDQAGAIGILQNREFWATHASFLNDAEEIGFAYKLLHSEIERRLAESNHGVLKAWFDSLTKSVELMRGLNNIYVCCFSVKYDDLNQWRSYSGSGNGYMLGLDPRVLRDEFPDARWSLLECVYKRDAQEQLIGDFLDRFEERLDGLFPRFGRGEINEGVADSVAHTFANYFAKVVAPSFKHPAFAEEEEWRLVFILGTHDTSSDFVRFRTGRSAITPYVALKLEDWFPTIKSSKSGDRAARREIIATLMVRPHFNVDFVKLGFSFFAESCGFSNKIVTLSSLPYRSY